MWLIPRYAMKTMRNLRLINLLLVRSEQGMNGVRGLNTYIEENWESSRPILFEHVVMSAAVPLLPARVGFSLPIFMYS